MTQIAEIRERANEYPDVITRDILVLLSRIRELEADSISRETAREARKFILDYVKEYESESTIQRMEVQINEAFKRLGIDLGEEQG